MKRDALIICLVVLLCSTALIIHSRMQASSLIESLPGLAIKTRDAIAAEDSKRRDAKITAELLADMEGEKIQKANQEREAFAAALARIPADVPEPQRSTAARHLIEIEKQDKLSDPTSVEAAMARALDLARRP